jgi:hypothetical protein
MSWSERYAIANEQEFNQAMGDQKNVMSRTLMDHYADMYDRHVYAINQLKNEFHKTLEPHRSKQIRQSIDKHHHCTMLIGNIMGMHMDGEDTGDHEDHYNAVARDAFDSSNSLLNI